MYRWKFGVTHEGSSKLHALTAPRREASGRRSEFRDAEQADRAGHVFDDMDDPDRRKSSRPITGLRQDSAAWTWGRPRRTSTIPWRFIRPLRKNSSPCAEHSGAAATLLERGQHLTRRGTHAVPQTKRLRGLLHQHAPALQRTRAPLPRGPLEERGRGLAVGQVVADRVRSDDRGREGRQDAS